MNERYFLDSDNDDHWYLIPTKQKSEWSHWLKIDPDDPDAWEVPDFVIPIGGSYTLVEFENPTIDGEKVGAVK